MKSQMAYRKRIADQQLLRRLAGAGAVLVGSKHVFRALSRAGRTDLALAMLKAKGCPGFLHWREAGGTTLWEDWWTGASRNHVMFCDFAAWAIEFLSILNNDPTP